MNWSSPNKVIIQGITESLAILSALQMQECGTEIVAAVSPGSGESQVANLPVFDLVEQAVEKVGKIDISLIFVSPYQVLDATQEAIAAGIKKIIIFTLGVPPLDAIKLTEYARNHEVLILGPGSQGIIIPQQVVLGQLQPEFYQPGKVGMITTSEHLSYEVAAELNQADIGQSIIVSMGEDRILASDLRQWLAILNDDPNTEAISVVGRNINQAQVITEYCQQHSCTKPIVVYLAGLKAPRDKTFNDAVSIISNRLSSSIPAVNRDRQKLNKLKKVGIMVAKKPSEIPNLIQSALSIV